MEDGRWAKRKCVQQQDREQTEACYPDNKKSVSFGCREAGKPGKTMKGVRKENDID